MKKALLGLGLLFLFLTSKAQWFKIATDVRDFAFSSSMVGYVCNMTDWVGSSGSSIYINKTVDGGLNWQTVYSDFSHNDVVMVFSEWMDTCFYTDASFCNFYRSEDGGVSWNYFTQPYCTLWDIFFFSSDAALMTTTQVDTNYIAQIGEYKFDLLIRSDTAQFFQISLNTDSIGFVTCKSGDLHSILLIKPPFNEWSNTYSTHTPLNDIIFTGDSVGYAVGDSGLILKTTNQGENWTSISAGVQVNLNNVDYLNDSIIYCVGDSGIVLSTTDGGDSWSKDVINSSENLVKIEVFRDSQLYVLAHTQSSFNHILYSNKNLSIDKASYPDCNHIKIYPNPFNDFIHISNEVYEPNLIQVTSIEGKLILLQEVNNINTYEIHTSSWDTGIYIISFISESYVKQLKLIKN